MAEDQRQRIGDLLPQLEAFQDYYDYDTPEIGQLSMKLKMGESSSECDQLFNKDPLFWCLHRLCDHEFEIEGLKSPSRVLGFLFSWMNSDKTSPEEKFRLEQRLLDDISSLATTHELLRILGHFRPAFLPATQLELTAWCFDHASWKNIFWIENDERQPPQKISRGLNKAIRALKDTASPDHLAELKIERDIILRAKSEAKATANMIDSLDSESAPIPREEPIERLTNDILNHERAPSADSPGGKPMAPWGFEQIEPDSNEKKEQRPPLTEFGDVRNRGAPGEHNISDVAVDLTCLGLKTPPKPQPKSTISQGFEHGEERKPGRYTAPLARGSTGKTGTKISRVLTPEVETTQSPAFAWNTPPMPTYYVKRKNVLVLQRLFPATTE
ncbi:hypothetical protein IFR05_009860 [Cadophora sp. M221]|nr:hypothetical protein IFR05_009860 [Cadophora sp. M221]